MTRRPMLVASFVLLLTACSGQATRTVPAASPTMSVPTLTAPTGSAQPSASIASNPLRLLVLGDSIAIPSMGCGACIGFDRQYASYLETLTGRPVTLDNQARPNAQIADLQHVLDTEPQVQDAVAAADIVIVSIGYNNTPPWAPDMPCHTPEGQKDADIWVGILAMTPQ